MTEPRQPLFPVPGWGDEASSPTPQDQAQPTSPTEPYPTEGAAYPDPGVPPPTGRPGGSIPPLPIVAAAGAVVVAVGAAAIFLFARDSGGEQTPTSAVPGGAAAGVTVNASCGTPPRLQPVRVRTDRAGLAITMAATTNCTDGDIVSTDALQVNVTDRGRDVAAGYFDLSRTPFAIPGKSASELTMVFPLGTYWLPENALSQNLVATVADAGASLSTRSATSRAVTVEAFDAASPTVGTGNAAATSALRSIAATDAPLIRRDIEDRWVPQLSSKRAGLVADGIQWSDADILEEHLALRAEYPQARLMLSDEWSTFSSGGWWVTAVAAPHSSGEAANEWCSREGFDRDHCFAKIISSTRGPDGTTLGRK